MLRFLILMQLFIVFFLLLLFFFHLGEVLQGVFVADKVHSPEKWFREKFVFMLMFSVQALPAPSRAKTQLQLCRRPTESPGVGPSASGHTHHIVFLRKQSIKEH